MFHDFSAPISVRGVWDVRWLASFHFVNFVFYGHTHTNAFYFGYRAKYFKCVD